MYMEVSRGLNMRVIDTLNFFPMKLAALPKAFGLEELCKGYFPHFANTRHNQSYVGPYPDPDKYGVDFMSRSEREAFLQWHEEKKKSGAIFDFAKEIEMYCRSDVDILRRASLQFRKLMLEATSVDPFRYTTIASVCMAIYKAKFLNTHYRVTIKEDQCPDVKGVNALFKNGAWHIRDSERNWELVGKEKEVTDARPVTSEIAQVASVGYVQRDTFSKASIQWLEYQMELLRREGRDIEIQHALNSGEVHILGSRYKVDGLSSEAVYEYHGKCTCYFLQIFLG